MNLTKFLRPLTLSERVDAELTSARNNLLDAHAMREQAEAAITALNQRVRRLEAEQQRLGKMS